MQTADFVLAKEPQLAVLPPLSLYLHVPWCLKKCPYCDFNSHALKENLPETEYVLALLRDLELSLPSIWGRTVRTVFIGGGTPSLFSGAALEALLSGIRARVALAPDAEITLEANPGTFETEKFEAFRDAGVTRLSLGIQSFEDRALRALGRVHGRKEALAAAQAAIRIFPRTNLDLMFALPDQATAAAVADLETAIELRPGHLSLYHLTIEPNTAFALCPPVLPGEDMAAEMEDTLRRRLREAGYEHYEVSAHALPGEQCRHNLNYWQFGDYLGLGAGAHAKISFPDRIVRQTRARSPKDYFAALAADQPAATTRTVPVQDLGFEFLLNALRLHRGVPSAWLAERTGLALASLQGPINEARRRGLLEPDPLRLVATAMGRRFLDDLVSLFLPEQG